MTSISGAIMRLHGPLTHSHVDSVLLFVGSAFIAASGWLLVLDRWDAGIVAAAGGMAIVWSARSGERVRMAGAWRHAAFSDDPITSLVLFEYLYSLSFRDLVVVSDWRAWRERAGLPMVPTDDDPPQVRLVWEHLHRIPVE